MGERKEYKYGKGFSILIIVLAIAFIAFGVWLTIIPWVLDDADDSFSLIFFVTGGILFAALGVVAIIDIKLSRFVIDNENLTTFGVLNNRSLSRSEIKGFRISDKYIYVEPISKKRKPVKISTSYSHEDELMDWLSTHFTNLDLKDYVEEYEEVLNNEEYGWNEEQRNDRLLEAKRVTKILNWAATIIFVWLMFFPRPYLYAAVSGVVCVLAVIVSYRMYKGLIRINEKNIYSPYPSIWWALPAPSITLALSAGQNINAVEYSGMWIPSVTIALLLWCVLVVRNREFSHKKPSHWFVAIFLAVILLAYGYGTTMNLNCGLDNTESRMFMTTISRKHFTSGKGNWFYFDLEPWGPKETVDKVKVDRTLYESLEEGDPVAVIYRKGKFGIPWFYVQRFASPHAALKGKCH